MSDLAIAPLGP